MAKRGLVDGKVRIELGGATRAHERYEAAEILQVEHVVVEARADAHAAESAVQALVVRQVRAHERLEVVELRTNRL